MWLGLRRRLSAAGCGAEPAPERCWVCCVQWLQPPHRPARVSCATCSYFCPPGTGTNRAKVTRGDAEKSRAFLGSPKGREGSGYRCPFAAERVPKSAFVFLFFLPSFQSSKCCLQVGGSKAPSHRARGIMVARARGCRAEPTLHAASPNPQPSGDAFCPACTCPGIK